MEIDVEMKVIHCSNPEENPLPTWLRKKEDGHTPAATPMVYPSFVRPIGKGKI